MPKEQKRHIEVRMLVIAIVDITSDELAAALKDVQHQPSSIADIVGQEVVSNLESVPYVDTAIVSHL